MTDAPEDRTARPAPCLRIDALLSAAGVAGRVRILPEAAPTAVAAAALIGCDVAAIANSLIFATAEQSPLLVLTSGAHRVDTALVARHVGTAALHRATPEFVRRHTGQTIGGVSPIGHPSALPTLLDEDLRRHDPIWAAGGMAHAVFPVSFDELRRLTGADVIRVA